MPVRQLCSSAEPGPVVATWGHKPAEAGTMDRAGPLKEGVGEKRPQQSGTQCVMGQGKQEESPGGRKDTERAWKTERGWGGVGSLQNGDAIHGSKCSREVELMTEGLWQQGSLCTEMK